MKTGFEPAKNGFHFGNSDIRWSVGPISARALCGGMVYAALDYFNGGLATPYQTDAPPDGTPLQQYIYDRQLSAHWNTVMRFADHWTSARPSQGEFELLRRYVRAMQPIPLCFYNGIADGHHTLAIGCGSGPIVKFDVYDPNYPDQVNTITPENGKYRMSVGGKLWKGFFVDNGYVPHRPKILEGGKGWLRCIDCRLIYHPGGNVKCPKGGQHNPQGSPKYVLALNSGNGDKLYRMCKICGGLVHMGPDGTGLCPAGGMHQPIYGLQYTIGVDGVGQNNWRRCIYCDSLFWLSGGGIGGICSGGEPHKSDLTKLYTIPFES